MAVISTGQTFSDGEQVTAAKLNTAVNGSTFDSGAVDNASTQLSGGAIIVKDSGVTTAKIADSNVTTAKIADANVTTAKIADSNVTTAKIADASITVAKLATTVLELSYPIGSIYTNATDATNPNALLGFGTWTAFGAGRVPVGIDAGQTEFDTAEETGGAKTHTLTAGEMPSHTHNWYLSNSGYNGHGGYADEGPSNSITEVKTTSSAGGDAAHNNLQPYIVVYMWKRTA